jgi:hypothetical protein
VNQTSDGDILHRDLAQLKTELLAQIAVLQADVSKSDPAVLSSLAKSMAESATRQSDLVSKLVDQVKADAESKTWKIIQLAVPVLLTALLGLAIWWVQTGITQRIDRASRELSMQLALTEDFYKKKLSIYENADKQMRQVLAAIRDLRFDPNKKKRSAAIDELRQLNDTAEVNGMYMSEQASQAIKDVWFLAANARLLSPDGSTSLQEISSRIVEVEVLMRKELGGAGRPLQEH